MPKMEPSARGDVDHARRTRSRRQGMTGRRRSGMEIFTAKDGRRLAYQDTGGDGPAVLCLAGLSRNSRDFEALSAHLADRYRVLRLDSRGRGGSERAQDPLSEYLVPVEAGDALALLDHLRLEQVALIGTSRGGILSMAMAGGAPERIPAVVLNDVGARVEGLGLLRILATLGREPEAQDFDAAAVMLREANARAFPDVPHAQWLRHAHALYDDDGSGRPVLSYDPRLHYAVAGAIEAGGDGPVMLWPLFEALKHKPVLVVRGENSDILSPETVEAMRVEHPDLEAVEVKARGHAPFLNEPEALAAIDSFLDRHVLGRDRRS